jgi:hypothetical protein
MESNSTKQDTVTATAPIALRAVARHLLDHDLEVDSISAPITCLGETSVIVHVNGAGDGYWSARWADTLHVDDKVTESSSSGLFDRHIVHGRLPDSGVRVSVVAVRVVVLPSGPVVGRRGLVSVPSGGAA